MPTLGDRIEFPLDRARLSTNLSWSVLASLGGASVLVPELRDLLMREGWGLVAFVASFLLIGGGFTVTTGALLLRRGPGLVMDHHGLHDRSRLVSLGGVEWDEVTWYRVDGGGAVVLDVSDAARARRRRDSRVMSTFRLHPVAVAFDLLDTDHDEVEAALERFAPSRRADTGVARAEDGVPSAQGTAGEPAPVVDALRAPKLGWRHSWIRVGGLAGIFVVCVAAPLAPVGRQRRLGRRGGDGELVADGVPAVARYHAAAVVYWAAVEFVGATLVAAGVLLFVDDLSRVPEAFAAVLVLGGAVLVLVGPRVPRWIAPRDGAGSEEESRQRLSARRRSS